MAFGNKKPPVITSPDSCSSQEPAPQEKIAPPFEEFSWYWSLAGRGKFNRRVVLGLLTGLAGGLGLFFSRGFKGAASAQPKDNRVATAAFAEGVLTVTRTDGSVKRLAGQGSIALYEGDKLQTGRVSQGYLIFRDGSRMALNANTTLSITSRKDDKGTLQVIKLAIGEIWAKISKKTKRFEVETPNALAAISGTEFGMNVEKGSIITTLTLGEGSMDFTNCPGAGITDCKTVKVQGGNQSNVRDTGKPSDPVMVNVDRILNWGRNLDGRFGGRGSEPEEGTQPLRKKSGGSPPSGPSHSQPY